MSEQSKGRVGMISLGCAKNRVDAERLLALIQGAGFDISQDLPCCDAVIVNTCGFIEDAKKESIDEIFKALRMKDNAQTKSVLVTGCLAERYHAEIRKEIPEVDAVIGIGANADIVSVLERSLKGEKVASFAPKQNLQLTGPRVLSTPKHYAYLKIAEGCDNRCSYCSIPLIRGNFRSVPLESILQEAEDLAESGVRELLVIAQDTTRYGEDLYGELMLPELLRRLCKIKKLRWIRVLYCYPDRMTDELIETIAREPKIIKYIDIPIQHCNAGLLNKMNRTGSRDSLQELFIRIRDKISNVFLRTTFIVGFPSEGEAEFTELCDFCQNVKFDRMGCFTYSCEEDTRAAAMSCQVDDSVKAKRQEVLMRMQEKISMEKNKAKIGKTIEVIVDAFDASRGMYIGRSEADAPEVDCNVFFVSHRPLNCGDFVYVKVNDCDNFDLIGERI